MILLPLIGAKGNCFGLLEISKLQEFEMDDEYSCILVILFGKLLVKQLKQLKLLKKELKYIFFHLENHNYNKGSKVYFMNSF